MGAVHKAGGIACLLAAIWLLTLLGPGARAEGYLLVGSLAISLCSLGVIGLFGRRFGIKTYYASGLMCLASGVIAFAASAWYYVTGPSVSAFAALTLPFLFMCGMALVGVKTINRADLLEGVDYLLAKWSTGTTMDWTQVMELLVVYNRDFKKLSDPNKFSSPVTDYLDELKAQGYIQEEGYSGSYSKQKYKRVK
jgi:UDP-N-acetylmuramyl pentapeptide phosphotransferase/UDP-N-acetylglucosamine-1-phosphate transferase